MADDQTPEPGSDTGVSRTGARQARADAKRKRAILWGSGVAAVAVLVIIIFVLTRGGGKEPAKAPRASTTTTSTSTTSSVPEALATAFMPLTGVPVNGEDPEVAARLMTPALAVKVDNAPQARPQEGIQDADIVIEVKVEGISRYIAVFQSVVPERVGPVRSARTSDPDLLAMFGKPVFAWSGGNSNVMKVIRSTPWIENAGHDRRSGDYSRERGRKAPHNLFIDARRLLQDSADGGLPPHQLFQYLGQDEESGGEPVNSFEVPVGSTLASFRWDPESGKWDRYAGERPELAANDSPIAATNVVVVQTPYRASSADRRSPEADSLGEGTAWVFTDGKMIPGRWSRHAREEGWTLTDEAGNPTRLRPGSTWVALPDTSSGPRPTS